VLNTKPELKLQLQPQLRLGREVERKRDMGREERREKGKGDLLGLGVRGSKTVE
jgi:hypothetical protein